MITAKLLFLRTKTVVMDVTLWKSRLVFVIWCPDFFWCFCACCSPPHNHLLTVPVSFYASRNQSTFNASQIKVHLYVLLKCCHLVFSVCMQLSFFPRPVTSFKLLIIKSIIIIRKSILHKIFRVNYSWLTVRSGCRLSPCLNNESSHAFVVVFGCCFSQETRQQVVCGICTLSKQYHLGAFKFFLLCMLHQRFQQKCSRTTSDCCFHSSGLSFAIMKDSSRFCVYWSQPRMTEWITEPLSGHWSGALINSSIDRKSMCNLLISCLLMPLSQHKCHIVNCDTDCTLLS